ncbi:DNA-3-methyladenine glycosylase 2 family protein [Rhizobiales bacterium TNE-4]|nr:DNA-3-methyladenine glycosylase 2 family protein [Rhizobiales bacterium TNE-4]MBV1828054.1 DNA-3-methyladenine glycosylase [Rhizobiales bacterium TNE-4]
MARKPKILRRFDAMLTDEPTLAEAATLLADIDPAMAEIMQRAGPPPLRKSEPGFRGIARIIVGQQVSVASAAAIWNRTAAGLDPLTPETVLAASEETLRACGLSAPKMRTLRAVAEAIVTGSLPLDTLHALPADEAHRLMIAVKGIGPWTADIYLLFCLGHPDAFPAGDLALQEAVRLAYRKRKRPDAKALAAFAERWRPVRGTAALALWAYYKVAKSREGV